MTADRRCALAMAALTASLLTQGGQETGLPRLPGRMTLDGFPARQRANLAIAGRTTKLAAHDLISNWRWAISVLFLCRDLSRPAGRDKAGGSLSPPA